MKYPLSYYRWELNRKLRGFVLYRFVNDLIKGIK